MASKNDEKHSPWRAELYSSGTALVTKSGPLYGGPYLTVRGLTGKDAGMMADEVADFLNGERDRPGWLDDMERYGESSVIGTDGSSVSAEGPMAKSGGSEGGTELEAVWEQDESPAARDERARLIDKLCMVARKPKRKR